MNFLLVNRAFHSWHIRNSCIITAMCDIEPEGGFHRRLIIAWESMPGVSRFKLGRGKIAEKLRTKLLKAKLLNLLIL